MFFTKSTLLSYRHSKLGQTSASLPSSVVTCEAPLVHDAPTAINSILENTLISGPAQLVIDRLDSFSSVFDSKADGTSPKRFPTPKVDCRRSNGTSITHDGRLADAATKPDQSSRQPRLAGPTGAITVPSRPHITLEYEQITDMSPEEGDRLQVRTKFQLTHSNSCEVRC
jgi:hypothetical protein